MAVANFVLVISSFLQYLVLVPSYINILMVYAFCNLHDVSWGTKGDNTTAAPLAAVKTAKDKDGKVFGGATDDVFAYNDPSKAYEKFVKR